MIRYIIAYSLLLLPFHGNGQSLKSVLERYFEVAGGREKIAQSRSSQKLLKVWLNLDIYGIGANTADLTQKVEPSIHREINRFPYWEFVEISDPITKKITAQFYANDLRNFNIIFNAIYPDGNVVEHFSANRHIIVHEALDLLEFYENGKLEYAGEKEIEGKCYQQVKVNFVFRPGYSFQKIYLFSPVTGQLEATKNGINPDEITRFTEYRSIDGLMYPFRREIFNKGNCFYRESVESILFNPEVGDSIFYLKPRQ